MESAQTLGSRLFCVELAFRSNGGELDTDVGVKPVQLSSNVIGVCLRSLSDGEDDEPSGGLQGARGT